MSKMQNLKRDVAVLSGQLRVCNSAWQTINRELKDARAERDELRASMIACRNELLDKCILVVDTSGSIAGACYNLGQLKKVAPESAEHPPGKGKGSARG